MLLCGTFHKMIFVKTNNVLLIVWSGLDKFIKGNITYKFTQPAKRLKFKQKL